MLERHIKFNVSTGLLQTVQSTNKECRRLEYHFLTSQDCISVLLPASTLNRLAYILRGSEQRAILSLKEERRQKMLYKHLQF